MSGPFILGDVVGAIDSFAIGASPAINGSSTVMYLLFSLIDDEAVFDVVIGGKLTGKNVTCLGSNVQTAPVCQRAAPLRVKDC